MRNGDIVANVNNLVKYDMRLPRRKPLEIVRAVAFTVIAIFLIVAFWTFALLVMYGPSYGAGGSQKHPINTMAVRLLDNRPIVVIVVVICMIVAFGLSHYLHKHYVYVYQGRVIAKNVAYPDGCVVQVEGYTHNNELRREWFSVSYKYWTDTDIGDFATFR